MCEDRGGVGLTGHDVGLTGQQQYVVVGESDEGERVRGSGGRLWIDHADDSTSLPPPSDVRTLMISCRAPVSVRARRNPGRGSISSVNATRNTSSPRSHKAPTRCAAVSDSPRMNVSVP